MGLFLVLIVLMTTGLVPTLVAAALCAVAMGCISSGDARSSVEWQVLITIAAAFGVGTALEKSGAATAIATALVDSTQAWGPIAALAAIYILGSILLLVPYLISVSRILELA
jgi:di/tricarboxylate transporter